MRSFNNDQVIIRPLEFKFTKKFVAAATGLENTGVEWFKNQKLERKRWQRFVKDKKMEVNWKCGVLHKALLGQWQDLLFVLQKFVTCEGRYTCTLVYHFRMLQNFEGGQHIRWRMKFPYFLLKILEKMARSIQNGREDQANARLYHHGLIKIPILK